MWKIGGQRPDFTLSVAQQLVGIRAATLGRAAGTEVILARSNLSVT